MLRLLTLTFLSSFLVGCFGFGTTTETTITQYEMIPCPVIEVDLHCDKMFSEVLDLESDPALVDKNEQRAVYPLLRARDACWVLEKSMHKEDRASCEQFIEQETQNE